MFSESYLKLQQQKSKDITKTEMKKNWGKSINDGSNLTCLLCHSNYFFVATDSGNLLIQTPDEKVINIGKIHNGSIEAIC